MTKPKAKKKPAAKRAAPATTVAVEIVRGSRQAAGDAFAFVRAVVALVSELKKTAPSSLADECDAVIAAGNNFCGPSAP